ncbi:hypothetical protein NESM_000443400 [Novymonas esmeraldas]|uniref:Uncharacterized protein n=1 Tax=Novymonas esmeraldas TaxID=1808958 RepID=A0AAW0ENY7_9TRYP
MPRSQGGGGGRYAAVVEKGENAWKREWSSFMSGVSLRRLRDGTSGVALKASADIERQLEAHTAASPSSPPSGVATHAAAAAAAAVNEDGIPVGAGFSYLFSSPAERRAERDARDRAERDRRQAEIRAQMAQKDPLSVLSKHQRATHDAEERGLRMDGMTRKERREFLHLTVTEAQKRAEAQSRDFKLHDLMDDALAWYQQGPHPIDLIAEKLVRRKAEKKAKQLGLRYNYLAPHPSWVAKRAQRRRESLLVGLGKRLIFTERVTDANEDDEDEAAAAVAPTEMMVTDPLHHRTVPLRDMAVLLQRRTGRNVGAAHSPNAADPAAAVVTAAGGAGSSRSSSSSSSCRGSDDDRGAEGERDGGVRGRSGGGGGRRAAATATASVSTAADVGAAPGPLPDVGVLQDPTRLATSFVRSVVRDRTTALAIQQANRTTTYLSSGLVHGPSLRAEDALIARGLPMRGLDTSAPSPERASPPPSPAEGSAAARRRVAHTTTTTDRKRVRAVGGEDSGRKRQRSSSSGAEAAAASAAASASTQSAASTRASASPSPRRRSTTTAATTTSVAAVAKRMVKKKKS